MKLKRVKVKRSRRVKHKGAPPLILKAFLGICFASALYLLWLPDVSEYRSKNPTTTSILEARKREMNIGNQFPIAWTKLNGVSPTLIRAVIVAEDSNFYGHRGVDLSELWVAIKDAFLDFELPRGASTITQQLAKNLYLSESYNPLRKIKEILIAKRLESQLGKKRILEIYLNVIEWGDGIFGIHAASRHYFGVSPDRLSTEQSAFLAALIPNPRTVYNPKLHPGRVERRKQLILRRM